jgi:hypothetical protein
MKTINEIFKQWLDVATVELNDQGGHRVLTDYDNCIEVLEDGEFISPIPLNINQKEMVYNKIYEWYYEPKADDYDVREEQGLYGYGY